MNTLALMARFTQWSNWRIDDCVTKLDNATGLS